MSRAVALAVMFVVTLGAGTAAADKKIQQMTPGFDREAQTCATQVSGLEKVQTGSSTLAPTLSPEDKAALDKDLETLAAGLTGVKTYCAEVTGLVEFLKANAAAPYKSVEKELDTRDNKVRKLRKDSKKTIEALQPITRRWIGKIAQAQTQRPDTVAKTTPGKFPSGRTVDLPPLGGQWKLSGEKQSDSAEYVDKAWTASVFVRSFSAATCEQQQRTLAPEAKPMTDAPISGEVLDTAWYVAARGAKSYTETICVRGPTGGWLGILEVKPAWTDAASPLRGLLMRMILAQRPVKTP
jgi:hypothetical protein